MESSSSSSLQNHTAKNEDRIKEEEEKPRTINNISNHYKEMKSTFPREKDWSDSIEDLYQYQDFWFVGFMLEGLLSAQDHFMARSTDIILASFMKTGTTWLKALAFAIVTRANFDTESTSPLLRKGPHDCIPFLEVDLVINSSKNRDMTTPLVSTHAPYTCLPNSIINSACKIVYIWRDPKDVFVSMWFFRAKILLSRGREPIPLEEAFEGFCKGIVPYGPYWDHILGYWKARQEFPERVLFLKYEEMKKNTTFYVKELAEFMGYPFTSEEEEDGILEKIVNMCNFENLSNLEVNKNGDHRENTSMAVANNIYFRKGNAGDWQNHLSPDMGARLDEIMKQKLMGSGLLLY